MSWNRREFTRRSFDLLLANTDWSLVDRLLVFDNCSTDGTDALLRGGITRSPVEQHYISHNLDGPVAVLNRYLDQFGHAADVVCKIDNDVAVPPGWLEVMSCVLGENPKLELLGMEGGRSGLGEGGACWDWEPCSHIGGVGLMRTSAFLRMPRHRPQANGRMGFTQWQHHYQPVRGWLTPDLPVCLLNQIPVDPWLSLSEQYIAAGWERPWARYDENSAHLWDWLDEPKEDAA